MITPKTRLVAVLGTLLLLLLVIDLVRRRKLKEEYSVLWVAATLVLMVLAAWYQLLERITNVVGGVALTSTLFAFALLFVFFMLLHYSVRISALERRLTALVQEAALAGVKRMPRLAGGADPPLPRVAVIVPCFDDGRLVPEALASIQEDEPVEVVVVDDGSTDAATLEVLAGLEADGVRVVRRENGGLGAARTTGLAATTAQYVYPLDADDRLEPGALAAMADVLDARPEAGFAWGDYVLCGDQQGRYRSPDRWLPWTLTYVNPYPVCSLLRRSTLDRAGGWQGRAYEDWDLWLRLVGLGIGGVRVDRVVYRRRLHGDSRLLQQARRRHQELYAELQRRNAAVFARRAELRAAERPAAWKRAVYPVLFGPRKVVPFSVEAFLQRTMMRLGTGLPG
jgi:glycosyltransferase involved in cell wall biosynthesis